MRVISAESTELFTGPPDAPLQLVRVTYTGGATDVRIEGVGLTGHAAAAAGVVEVPVAVEAPIVGEQRDARVLAGDDSTPFVFTVAEPGWTMYMISHFHYDPVWWNTQAAYTSVWTEDPPGRARQTNGFDLVRAHLEMARREPEYKFVLAEVDYLKPYWDTHPEDRADLRRFIADGRVEIMGGTYNEPNTNLTSPETTIRNFVHGMGFQRDVLGADPATAWQLDAFGHDPQFPGMAADAGLTSSSWARGPHHQWGPMHQQGDPRRMQFSSEFEWIAPSGRGLLTHYMPAHYSAGWWMDSAVTLEEAEAATYELFASLKKVALTRNVLLPVGTDYTPPNKWVTEIHRDWNARYTWPRFVCALPSEFFAAVRAELSDRGVDASPQTRDMNPIYTGKDVSYIDTKQANRAAEDAVLDAERFAVFAGLLCGTTYPQAALAKAWVQLAYGAHHDAITGSESDQVYLDLLTGWRDAWELGRTARDNALQLLSSAVDGSVVVWNALAHKRNDIVTARLTRPIGAGVRVLDCDGAELPVHVEHGGRSVSWLARDVPSMGWQSYRLVSADAALGWEPLDGLEIGNEHYRLRVDPSRGGGVSSLVEIASERELIASGKVGNELAIYEEYPAHPEAGEGPWHLLPKGPVVVSSTGPASVQAFGGPLGQRLVVRGRIGDLLRYTQTLTLWRGVARVDCQTTVDEFTGVDQLVRLRWPCPVPGACPVSEVGDAVIGRGFGLTHDRNGEAVDSAQHPSTLDNPAYGWFGLSSAARVRVGDAVRAVAVAEVVSPDESASASLARDLMVALVRAGVTATCSSADKPRYGDLAVDSNLPDVRISLGGPDQNAFTAAVLAEADPAYTEELKRQLYSIGAARVWVPSAAPLADEWVPGADLRGVQALPVLVIAGASLDVAVAAVVADLADAEIDVEQQVPAEHGAVRVAHRRGAQPRNAKLRRGFRRHAAHLAHAFVHRLAVRNLDRPAAANGARRLQLPAAALDPHVRLCAGLRRRRLARSGCARPQRGVLPAAARRRRKHQGRRRITGMGVATGDRAGGQGATRRAQGRRQPVGQRQRPARAPVGRRRGTSGRNMRRDDRCRGALRAAPGVGGVPSRPARAAASAGPRLRWAAAAWLRDRHCAHPFQLAPGTERRSRDAGPRCRSGATSLRQVLVAQPRPRAARRAAGRRSPAPPTCTGRTEYPSGAATHRRQ